MGQIKHICGREGQGIFWEGSPEDVSWGGFKEISRGAAVPAVDTPCPGSLENSGHGLAAASLLASLLVGPARKHTHKKKM